MAFVVLTTPQARVDIAKLRGKPAARYVRKVEELRSQGCKAAGYRLTGYGSPWICCVHLYAHWRLLMRFGNDDRIHILAVGEHNEKRSREDVYRRVMHYIGLEPPEDAERTKPPCCGKPSEIETDTGALDDFLAAVTTIGVDRAITDFLSGDREVAARIRRARR